MSKQATAGSPGSALDTASSAASDFGWCSGARSTSSAQPAAHRGVDPHRLAEALAAVHDPVPDRVGLAKALAERRPQLAGVESGAGASQLAVGQRARRSSPSSASLTLLEPALTTRTRNRAQRRGADARAPLRAAGDPGQVQSRTSGASSPTSRV